MAWRKGYNGELRAKKELEAEYPDCDVIKIAIAQIGADFMVICHGSLLLVVEVKETIHIHYYPSKKEKKQFERIKEFAKIHDCKAELWIYYTKGSGKVTIKEVRELT